MRQPRVPRAAGRQPHVPRLRADPDGRVAGDPNARRLEIARRVVERYRGELGDALVAAAVYGSVAHGAARERSDVELTLAVADSVPARWDLFFEEGILVECDVVPAGTLLSRAGDVTPDWGIKADAYRHQREVYDPDAFFQRLRATAHAPGGEAFERALAEDWAWWWERRSKFRGRLDAGDVPGALYLAWEFAYKAAMRIALHERRPYESLRTLWADAASRGYGVDELVTALVSADLERIASAIETVWRETGAWGAPSERAAP